MKKYLIGIFGPLIFLTWFVSFYKTSGKFRQSMTSAFVAMTIYFSVISPAHSAGAGQADAFTQQNQQHQSRSKNKGIFSRKSNNNGSRPGKPNGNGSDRDDDNDGDIPKYPKPESIEETQRHMSTIDEQIRKLEEITDSDSETEENQCPIKPTGKFEFDFELDQNGNPIFVISMTDGSIQCIEFDQTRDKWYHADVFPNISAPDGFDNQAVRALKRSDKLAYLRENIPKESVIALQIEIAKSLSHPDIIPVLGFLGKHKY